MSVDWNERVANATIVVIDGVVVKAGKPTKANVNLGFRATVADAINACIESKTNYRDAELYYTTDDDGVWVGFVE